MPKRPDKANTASMRSAGWYDMRHDVHTRFAAKLKTLIVEMLVVEKIQIDRVECRVKTRSSFLAKADREENGRRKYKKPTFNIKDVVGIRVVTYLDSAVKGVCALVEREFLVDSENSVDKDAGLGTDRVGYRSRHYVAQLDRNRAKLVEFAEFKDILFEIQVRSMLQHAWAEVEHDRRFKYPGELPLEVRRRYSLIAGQLEIADRELNNLAEEIERHTLELTRTAGGSSASKRLTVERMSTYMRGVFAEEIVGELMRPSFGATPNHVVDELAQFGVRTVGALAKLCPKKDYRLKALAKTSNTFLGVLRRAMMLSSPEKYFAKAWQHRWNVISPLTLEALSEAGIDLLPHVAKHKIAIRADQ